jgi:hypothetical protein
MKLWMTRSDGKPSASVTFAAIAFAVTTIWFALSIVGKVGPVSIRPFDSSAAMAYLMPILALYFGRRYTDAQVGVTTAQNFIGSNSDPGVVGLNTVVMTQPSSQPVPVAGVGSGASPVPSVNS